MTIPKVCEEVLTDGFTILNIPLHYVSIFLHYLSLLVQWNRVYNLTAIRDPLDMVNKHLLDSVVIQAYLHGQRILDVGTGAGLPGIPLAILNPEREFVLLDSNGKKIRFLTEVVRQLKLVNVTLVQARCETYQDSKRFDTITSRAFAALIDMLSLTQHLRSTEGQWLAMKGEYPQAELDVLPAPYHVLATHKLQIPKLNVERHLIIVG